MEDTQSLKAEIRCNEYSESDRVAIPFYFRHQDLIRNYSSNKTIKQRKLINLWNRIHFMDGMVNVHLRHPLYQEDLLIQAYPVPCNGNSMTCHWPEENGHFTENASILNIILTDGLTLFLIPATDVRDIQKDHFTIQLPDKVYILGQRQARHYRCQGINTEMVQYGFQAHGHLTDFSSLAFSIKLSPEETDTFRYFDAEYPSTVNLFRDGHRVFSASCRCIRQTSDQGGREIVWVPTTNKISRFIKKKLRNPRVEIKPLPNIAFEHPLIRKNIQLDVKNISTSGFTVDLTADEDVLMTGMIIPDLAINFIGAFKIQCTAQVIYRRVEKNNHIRYGFVILDMDIVNYNRLSHIILNIIDPGTHIADTVDLHHLWKLFFESGFIYPMKYELVQANRKSMKETYQRLYRDNPAIIAQLTYQQNGRIYGHVSMVRSYDRTWMVHHLAAIPLHNKRTGLQILKQIVRYFDGLYRLPSVGMDYMMFYFRPENHFPNHFFGGFARYLNNPRACSLDLFSHLNYPTSCILQPLPEGWSLEPCTDTDVEELNRFYQKASGGLLLDVVRLGKNNEEGKVLSRLYARYGLTRSYQGISLKQNGSLKAVLIVNQSDAGLSLADFLNGIKILVIDEAGLPWPILSAAISQLAGNYKIEQIPILVYPSDYLSTQGITLGRQYNLWIMDVDYGQEYGEYMMENTKFKLKFIARLLIKKYLRK